MLIKKMEYGTGIRTMIPVGALCGQDFEWFRWPRPTDDSRTIFFCVKQGDHFILSAPGYGMPGEYGRGSIHIHKTHFKFVDRRQPRRFVFKVKDGG
jgi:hypothetical protein